MTAGATEAVAGAMRAHPGDAAVQRQGQNLRDLLGLPMSVLLEVIQQHPELKSRIHEIVSRRDLSEPDKMAQIQLIVREAGAAPSNSQ